MTVVIAKTSTLEILPSFDIDFFSGSSDKNKLFEKASYIFDETSIFITISGLIIVALFSLLIGLGIFRILPNEKTLRFRIRLMLYTIAHLSTSCIISLYLLIVVGTMSYPGSFRLHPDNSFIWSYPSFAIIIIIYIVELYGFMTKNHKTE